MYRAVINLKTGKRTIPRGEAFARGELADSIARQLLTGGRIEEVHAPPIAQLPQFKEYAGQLEEMDITMADQFVDMGADYLAAVLHVDARRIRELQDAVTKSLAAPQPGG